MELNDKLYNRILDICSEGDKYIENIMYEKALEMYKKALELIPEPKRDWEASTWIYSALGDVSYNLNDFNASKNFFFDALNCPGGIVNPFIMLRLGESLYELGQNKMAKEYLLRAYMLEGKEIFTDENEKYLKLIEEEF